MRVDAAFVPFCQYVGEIEMVTDPSPWQHAATGENSADLCTRESTPGELLENSLWWHEPKWLLPEY